MDAGEKHQTDAAEQVARVRARARPWRSIIALVLAAVAAAASRWASDSGTLRLDLPGNPTHKVISAACAVAFGLFAMIATLGLSGKARDLLRPRTGSAHAAVVRYGLVLVGGLTTVIITLELLTIPVGSLVLGGAFTAVLIGIAAQQALSNLFAGIVLLLARPFAVGDSVRMRAGALGGQIEGVVTDIGITYVRLVTDDGNLNVPNSQVLAAAVGPFRHPPAVVAAGFDASVPGVPGAPPVSATSATSAPVGPAAAAAPPPTEAAPQHARPAAGPDGAGYAGTAERGT
ncbi:MAG: mechanosensitive ion channel domain-containing protein [Streptosporangiaceae bacterium]|jgi:small-conductance mechanosensitive channel